MTDTIREFMRRGVVVRTIINGLVFDGATTDPMQAEFRDALIGFMAALSQAQAEATKEAQKAGVAHAKAKGEASPYRGRAPSFDRARFTTVQDMLGQGSGVSTIAKTTGLTPADRVSHPG